MKKTVQKMCWLFVLMGLALPLQANWNHDQKSPQQTSVLNQVEALVEKTPSPVVIFDLDSTLYDNRPRSAAIWREYGRKNNVPALKKVKTEHITSWVIGDYLVKDAGLDAKWVEENIQALKAFWAERFFSNAYVKQDRPLPGAVAYVKTLYNKGATIAYISGRDEANMKEGTLKCLKRDGFPVGVERTHLFLKPGSNVGFAKQFKTESAYKKALIKADNDFKNSAVQATIGLGRPVASFDNEPGAINFYYRKLHRGNGSVAVWLDTDHSPVTEKVQKGILKVSGFKR